MSLRTIFRTCFLAGVLSMLAYTAHGAEPNGGAGQFQSGLPICVKRSDGPVVEVCGKYLVRWKLWSLMGEPVGEYLLTWKLQNIALMDRKRKLVTTFTPANMPAELAKGAAAIELYVDAVSDVRSPGMPQRQTWSHHFNTGTPTRAGVESLNVPGSPDWSKLFVDFGDGCNTATPAMVNFAESGAAKRAFIAGIQLTSIRFCSGSSASNLEAIESAIADLCAQPGSAGKRTYCPAQKEEPKSKAIDDAFRELEGNRRGNAKTPTPKAAGGKEAASIDAAFKQIEADEIKRRADLKAAQDAAELRLAKQRAHEEAQSFCAAAFKEYDSCSAQGCGSRPSESTCLESVEVPHTTDCPPDTRCLIIPRYRCAREGPNPKFDTWKACMARPADKCGALKPAFASMDSCVAARERNANLVQKSR